MLGELVCDFKGRLTGRRVLPHEGGIKLEQTIEQTGKILRVDVMDTTTFDTLMKPEGILFGMGQGMTVGKGGEMAIYYANGVGRMTGKGTAASFRGALYLMTQSPVWASLNGIALVFEYEADDHGNTRVQAWEWK